MKKNKKAEKKWHPMDNNNSQGGPAGMNDAVLSQTRRQMYVVSVQTFMKQFDEDNLAQMVTTELCQDTQVR